MENNEGTITLPNDQQVSLERLQSLLVEHRCVLTIKPLPGGWMSLAGKTRGGKTFRLKALELPAGMEAVADELFGLARPAFKRVDSRLRCAREALVELLQTRHDSHQGTFSDQAVPRGAGSS